MTLESWTLIFSAATSSIVLVGGIWLKYVVAQQLATKDAAIEALKAAITSNEAEISALKGERAPEIAKDYRVMLEHAETVTGEKNRLNEELQKLTEKQKKAESYRPILQLNAEIDALAFASSLLSRDIIEGLQQVTGKSRSCTNLDIDKIPTSTFLMKFINTNSTLQKRLQERLVGLRQNITTLEQNVEANRSI